MQQFSAKDKIAVAQKIAQAVDLSKEFLGDYVADAQRFVSERGLKPSDQPQGDQVQSLVSDKGFSRVYYDGRVEPIERETFIDESIYNFLPDRFKTYKPGG